eukprot:14047098-Heterocapsa_arctica.AAC.1
MEHLEAVAAEGAECAVTSAARNVAACLDSHERRSTEELRAEWRSDLHQAAAAAARLRQGCGEAAVTCRRPG